MRTLEQLWGSPGPHRPTAGGSCHQTPPGGQRAERSPYFSHCQRPQCPIGQSSDSTGNPLPCMGGVAYLEVGGVSVTCDGFAGEDGCGGGDTHLEDQQDQQEAAEAKHHHLETAPPSCHSGRSATHMADTASYELTLSSRNLAMHLSTSEGRELPPVGDPQSCTAGRPHASCQHRKATPATPTTTLNTFHTRTYLTCNHSSHMTCPWTPSAPPTQGGSRHSPARWSSSCEPPESERQRGQTGGRQSETPAGQPLSVRRCTNLEARCRDCSGAHREGQAEGGV